MLPYYGSERELAGEIWAKLRQHGVEQGSIPLPPVRIDLTRLDGVQRAGDVVNDENPPLLLYDHGLLSSPGEAITGRWNMREEDYEGNRKRMDGAPEAFLQIVALV